MSVDRTRLAEFGGHAKLTKAWAVSLLQRMGYTKRKGTTKSSLPENMKFQLLNDIIDTVKMEASLWN